MDQNCFINELKHTYPVYVQDLRNRGTPSKIAFEMNYNSFFILSPNDKYAIIFKDGIGNNSFQVVNLFTEVPVYITVNLDGLLHRYKVF